MGGGAELVYVLWFHEYDDLDVEVGELRGVRWGVMKEEGEEVDVEVKVKVEVEENVEVKLEEEVETKLEEEDVKVKLEDVEE